ncbi:hypothetical protein JY430_02485 [Stenotrophomonas maltophilia]|nr:hypothetical protein [Stenotrophomonas maltophilia]
MKVLVIAGNGLSISLMGKSSPEVDLFNLFARGGDVSWPASNAPGFLSYEFCPNLWALGARHTMAPQKSYELIEQIITAVNACCLADPSSLDDGIYIRAYKELVSYLRYLFVHYDNFLINRNFFNKEENQTPLTWLFDASLNKSIESINVVTFNYDAFLERFLDARKIDYRIPLLTGSNAKLAIHKPHGSITFCGKKPLDQSSFAVNYNNSFTEGGLDDLIVRYEELDSHYSSTGILPPAGDSDRYKHRWIRQIWDEALEGAASIGDGDIVIIYGLSYWHVDRREIDALLTKVSRKARVISINPTPNHNFEAVCCSLFKSYHSYSAPNQLARLLK